MVAVKHVYLRFLLVGALLCGLMGCRPAAPDPLPPDVPGGLSASDGLYGDRVRVTWEGVQGSLHYTLERSTVRDGPFHHLADTEVAAYDDTEVVLDLKYWYRVRACNEAGCSVWSEPESGYAQLPPDDVPPAPTGLSASPGDFPDRIRVQWAEAPEASAYDIFRSDEQFGSYSQVGVADTTSFDDTAVVAGRSYWYRVRSCNPVGCSGLSETAAWGFAQVPPDGAPNPPRAIAVSEGEHEDRIAVSWPVMAGATRYEVFRGETEGGPYTQIGSATDTSYEDVHDADVNPLTACKDYWYRVKACNDEGCSAFSPSGSGYRGTRMTAAVSNLSATDGVFPDRIRITWDPVPGAVAYKLYRGWETNLIAESEDSSYDDTTVTLASPTAYQYYVRACGAPDCGCGPLSLPVSGSASNLPAVPVDVAATARTGPARIEIVWEAGDSIVPSVSYDVFRSTSPTAQYTKLNVEPITSPAFTDTTGSSGTTYWYYVRGVNANGSGAPSAAVSATMP